MVIMTPFVNARSLERGCTEAHRKMKIIDKITEVSFTRFIMLFRCSEKQGLRYLSLDP